MLDVRTQILFDEYIRESGRLHGGGSRGCGGRKHGREPGADPTDAVAVRAAVAGLPERQRRALVLRYWFDLPVAQVAETMRCPENTVKTLTRRALLALRAAHVVDDEVEVADVN